MKRWIAQKERKLVNFRRGKRKRAHPAQLFAVVLGALIVFGAFKACGLQESRARASEGITEYLAIAKDTNVSIVGPSEAELLSLYRAIASYRGQKAIISISERAANSSSVWQMAKHQNITIRAPKHQWEKIIRVALRLPHDCNGQCAELFSYRDWRPFLRGRK